MNLGVMIPEAKRQRADNQQKLYTKGADSRTGQERRGEENEERDERARRDRKDKDYHYIRC